METRHGLKTKQAMASTPAEVEVLLNQLKDKEVIISERSKAVERDREELAAQREAFERERELNKIEQDATKRDLEQISFALRQREEDMTQPANPSLSHQDDNKQGAVFSEDLDSLRREIDYLKRTSCFHVQPGRANPSSPAREITDSSAPRVTFREALESVPIFDGYNISLTQFTRACRRAREIIPPSGEGHLARLLTNKLQGRAYYAVEDEPCETVTRLLDLLNSAFGPSKTIDQYKGELSTIFLRPNEHILDYIARVKELRASILDAERREIGGWDNVTTDGIDALTARSFCEGLPLEYRLQLRPDHYVRPFEAFSIAKILAKRHELERERYNTPSQHGGLLNRISNGNPKQTPATTPARAGTAESRNRDTGYRKPAPPPRHQEPESQGNTPITGAQHPLPSRTDNHSASQTSSPRSNDTKWCRYCKNQGHEINECRKREYNNSRNRSGNYSRPPGNADEPRAGLPHNPIRPITTEEPIDLASEESQS